MGQFEKFLHVLTTNARKFVTTQRRDDEDWFA